MEILINISMELDTFYAQWFHEAFEIDRNVK